MEREQVNEDSSNPFVRYSPPAVDAVEAAFVIARQSGANSIEPIHILIGLVRDREGIVPQILAAAHAQVSAVQRDIEQLIAPMAPHTLSELPFSASMRSMLSGADCEAKSTGALLTEPQHLFLALLVDPDSPEARVLSRYDLDLDTARTLVESIRARNKTSET
jgi:ATP-dependent Clp protease ATP-binding subunit ClpA